MNDAEVLEHIEALRAFKTDHRYVEAKRAKDGLPKTIWQTLSAFSNAPGGGIILLGVDENADFAITGVGDAKKIMQDLASLCDIMHPPLRPPIDLHRIGATTVISCDVAELTADEKPCFYGPAGLKNGTYTRVSDGDRALNDYEIHVLRTARGHTRDDEAPVVGASADDLDPELLTPFFANVRATRATFAAQSDDEILRRTKVLVPFSEAWVPSLAGLLVFGKDPSFFFPQLRATFVAYPTNRLGELGPNGEKLLDNGEAATAIPRALKPLLDLLHRNIRRPNVANGANRANVWELPDDAIREALVNALVHRDLSPIAQGTPVQIHLFPNRLAIISPGGLHGAVTLDRLGEDGLSSSRNQTLMRLLEDVTLPGSNHTVAESRGSGIATMIDAVKRARLTPPTFEDTIATFRVTFPRHSLLDEDTLAWLTSLGAAGDGLTDDQRMALALMYQGEQITNQRYRQISRLDSRVATRELRELVRRGLIRQESTGRWTQYRLADALQRPVAPASAAAGPMNSPASTRQAVGVASPVPTPVGSSSQPSTGEPDGVKQRRDRRPDILRLLHARGEVSRAEIQVALGLTTAAIVYWLGRMRTDKAIELTTKSPRDPGARYRLRSAAAD
jgi:ATP-dependent DNA helicase RecG